MKINLKYQFNTFFLNSAILTAILLFFLQTTTLFSSVDIIGTVTAKRANSLKVSFQPHEKSTPRLAFLSKNMTLNIDPKPDTLIRVIFNFKKIKERYKLQNPVLTTPKRVGFHVLEWGGILE